eukprot:11148221-Alexandrium_andersonii.AAC.1
MCGSNFKVTCNTPLQRRFRSVLVGNVAVVDSFLVALHRIASQCSRCGFGDPARAWRPPGPENPQGEAHVCP